MTTKSDGRAPMDLVAATADEESCRGVIPAIGIDVGDEARQVTSLREADHGTCVAVPNDTSTAFAGQYCDLKIDSARAANISASLTKWCAAQDPPIDCSAAFKPSAANSTTSASSATYSSTANPSTTAQPTTGPSTTGPSTTDASKKCRPAADGCEHGMLRGHARGIWVASGVKLRGHVLVCLPRHLYSNCGFLSCTCFSSLV